MRPFLIVVALLASSSLSISCGGGASAGESETSGDEHEFGEMVDEPVVEHRGDAVETLGITGPDRPWAEMSRQDREMYMVGKVLPIMNQLFREQFPARYAEGHGFNCGTCHGADGAARGWAMPSGAIMPLPARGTPAADSLAAAMPESMRFMRETVTPAMGTLLGAEQYRCSGCHTSAP